MNNIANWTEITHGIYRYGIGPDTCYEIHIRYWDTNTDILSANAKLYIVADWDNITGGHSFERELVLEGPLCACLQAAIEDYEKIKR